MIRTLSNHSSVVASLPIELIDADDTFDGTGVAVGGYKSAMVVVFAGVVTDGTYTVEVQDSDDDSTYAAVADAYLEGAEPAIDASDTLAVIGYKGTRKYLRVSVTSTDTTEGGTLGALIVLADPTRSPTR